LCKAFNIDTALAIDRQVTEIVSLVAHVQPNPSVKGLIYSRVAA
jgi:hypothetical protein